MFETDVSSRAVAHLVDEALDGVGTSPRRWAAILILLIVGALALHVVSRRRSAAEQAVPPADQPRPT
jgi:hypothetical protein